jgi:histone H3/H4
MGQATLPSAAGQADMPSAEDIRDPRAAALRLTLQSPAGAAQRRSLQTPARQSAYFRQTASMSIRRMPILRMIREIMRDINPELRCKPAAALCLQMAVEAWLVSLFEDAGACATHGRRMTVMPKDLWLALLIRGEKPFIRHQKRQ